MKKKFTLLSLSFLIVCMITFSSCTKDEAEIPAITTPSIITTTASGITTTSAVTGGVVTNGGPTVMTARGVCWSTAHNPTVADTTTSEDLNSSPEFSSTLAGLMPNTTYYFRAYATNGAGTAYGNEISFTTNQVSLATITTAAVTNITIASAASGGKIISDGGDTATDWGVCWSISPNPSTSNGKTTVLQWPDPDNDNFYYSQLFGLQPSTKYYVRSYATNSAGTAYGNELSFTTSAISPINFNPDLTYGSVSDIDGNIYKTIRIGTQVWMAENLKTTKYNDGSLIPNVTDYTEWKNLTSGGYSWYNNDASTFKDTYGALYNWYTVTDSRNVCPAGWSMPKDGDWFTLATYLGGEEVAGGKAKETGTIHWLSPNAGATNETGFTGLPGGFRFVQEGMNPDNSFLNLGASGAWWSATPSSYQTTNAEAFWIYDHSPNGFSNEGQVLKISGLSVRCVKDNEQ